MCDYIAGDIVECVDDTPNRHESQVMPTLGALYTVTSIRPHAGELRVRLKELAPRCREAEVCVCGDCGWSAARFRRIYRPTDALIAGIKARLWRETV